LGFGVWNLALEMGCLDLGDWNLIIGVFSSR